jgi:hypothetical protein
MESALIPEGVAASTHCLKHRVRHWLEYEKLIRVRSDARQALDHRLLIVIEVGIRLLL